MSREHFAQAEYLLFAALHVIPEVIENELEESKEIRAMIQSGLGRYYQRRLEVGVALYAGGQELI
jgi:hypothetical protein